MIITSILILAVLGFAVAIMLGFASKIFYVEEDPKVEAVIEALPGANCGGCGYAGCEGYAIAVVNVPNVPANLCVAGGAKTAAQVGELTGKAVTESDPLLTFRRCDKISGKVAKRYSYQGLPSCAAAATLAQGSDICAYSCLGFGDCVVSNKDIVILGGLYGQAYAGGCGEEGHFVVALEMSPEKLKIGDFKYKTSEKQSKWSIRPKVQPKIAYVEDGRVLMEPITKELLNNLPV